MKTTTINSGGFRLVNYFSKASLIPNPLGRLLLALEYNVASSVFIKALILSIKIYKMQTK